MMLRRHHKARAIGTTGADSGDADQAATFDLFTVSQLKDAIDRYNSGRPKAEHLGKGGSKDALIDRLTGAVELEPAADAAPASTDVGTAGPGQEAPPDFHEDDPTHDAGNVGSTPDTRIGANEPAGQPLDPETAPAQMPAQPAPEGQPQEPQVGEPMGTPQTGDLPEGVDVINADNEAAGSGVTTSADTATPTARTSTRKA